MTNKRNKKYWVYLAYFHFPPLSPDLPSGVYGKAPAVNDFGVFQIKRELLKQLKSATLLFYINGSSIHTAKISAPFRLFDFGEGI